MLWRSFKMQCFWDGFPSQTNEQTTRPQKQNNLDTNAMTFAAVIRQEVPVVGQGSVFKLFSEFSSTGVLHEHQCQSTYDPGVFYDSSTSLQITSH